MNNDIINELSTNFIEYAYACNSDRSIPDAKTGLKPVARRILWACCRDGYKSSKPHVKSARIAGNVIGSLHPHSDDSVYLAMIRLSQNWVLRYPLIDVHGNNGNVLGDDPAAPRYTEARLTKLAEEGLLAGIKKKNVDFMPNYDETEEEPCTLPAIFPNLLCNPNKGIGVALATNFPSHNLREVGQAINDYLDGKEPMLDGPDFPGGGLVINKNDIPAIMRTGSGSVKIRGQYKIEKNKIIFYEIPFETTVEGIIDEIGELCENKEIEGLVDAHDESGKKGLRIVIECGKNVSPEYVVSQLFAKTSLQSSFAYNMTALNGKTPVKLNLEKCIEIYVNHNEDCIRREAEFDLKAAKERKEIVEGLLNSLVKIDEIIALIKASKDKQKAKENLISKYDFTDRQAEAILAMRLSSLTKLDSIELKKENSELEDKIIDLQETTESKEKRLQILREKLATIVNKYGDARRTELVQLDIPKATREKKEVVKKPPQDVIVTTTQSGMIKRVPATSVKTQKRGGKGIKSKDDVVLDVVKTNTEDCMLFFSSLGKMHKLTVESIPDNEKGTNINNLIQLVPGEKVVAVSSYSRVNPPTYIIFATKKGMVKRSLLTDYCSETKRNTKITAIKLKDGDSIVDVIFQDREDVIIFTKKGMGSRLPVSEIPISGRVTIGTKGIKMKEDDEIVKLLSIINDDDYCVLVDSTGHGKKIEIKTLERNTRRAGGQSFGENIVGIEMVSSKDNVLIFSDSSSIALSVEDIPTHNKNAQGVILIRDAKNITGITKI